MKITPLLLLALLPQASPAQSGATAGEHPLRLKQWDWHQALEAPRQGYLQRERGASATDRQQTQQALTRERQQEQQLFERQRREHLSQPASRPGSSRPPQDLRRMQQQQNRRFKAESDKLRLQQDIQRRALGR